MPSELWGLYVVTATGNYIAIPGSRPTEDRDALEQMTELIKRVRPGFGRHYDMQICLLNSDWEPVASDRTDMQIKSERLLDING
jgi:hypothetical protein